MRSLVLAGSILASSLVVVAQDGIVRNMLIRGTNTTAANVGTLTVPTLTAPRTFTFPDLTGMVGVVPPGSTGFVEYGLSLPQDVLVANGTARLFDVRYNGSPTGAAQGARIHSSSAGAAAGTSANGLQIFSIAAGGGVSTSTALSLSATGGVFNNALVVDAGDVRVNGGATFLQATTLGSAATDAIIVNGEIRGASPLSFEGATNDDVRTTFAITDPTASRTITFPNATGTVALVPAGATDLMHYGVAATQNTETNGARHLFDVAYTGAATATVGARIASVAGGVNQPATALTLSATGTGTGASTALDVTGGTIRAAAASIPDATDMTSRELVAYNTGTNILERVTVAEAFGGTPVLYGVAAPQSTLGNGAQHLFNLEYSSTISVPAVGARIASVTNIGTAPDANATGLTVVATTNGTGTATALSVGASGGATNIAIDVTAGNVNTSTSSVINAGGRLNVNNVEVHTPAVVAANATAADVVLAAFAARYIKLDVQNTTGGTPRNVTFAAGVDGQRLTVKMRVGTIAGGGTVTLLNTRVTQAGNDATVTPGMSGQDYLQEWLYDADTSEWVLISSTRIL